MILTLLGTHQQQFNRLLMAVDKLVLEEPRIYQTGYSGYVPDHGQSQQFFSYNETMQLIRDARVVVCHAGTGTVMSILEQGKCPVVVARLAQFDEHVDDHQLQLVEELSALGLIVPFMLGDTLADKINEAASKSGQRKIAPANALIEHLHQTVRGSALRRIKV